MVVSELAPTIMDQPTSSVIKTAIRGQPPPIFGDAACESKASLAAKTLMSKPQLHATKKS